MVARKGKGKAQKASAPDLRPVEIVVRRPDALRVRITGDFTQWSKEGSPLELDGEGCWSCVLKLPPGEYQYRLLVDGEWTDHEDAASSVENAFGTRNGILKVM